MSRTPEDFINWLVKTFNFKADDFYDWDNFEQCFRYGHYNDFTIETGMTKGVFVPLHENYVIKVPFDNCDGLMISDFIQREIEIYNKAKEEELEKFFLPNIKIMRAVEHMFYAQEKVQIKLFSDEDACPPHWVDELLDKCISEYDCEDAFGYNSDYWIYDFITHYGISNFKKLCRFCKENDIIDLHQGNLGYTSRNLPVIVDYGGIENSF